MLALPLKPAVGVKTAVRVRPGPPLRALSVPPVSTMSLASKLLLGSSVKLKVIVAVSPSLSVLTWLVMASAGAMVSIAITGVGAAAPALPATSV